MKKIKQNKAYKFSELNFEKDYSISLTDAVRFTRKWRETKKLDDPISFQVPIEGLLQLLDRAQRNNIDIKNITFYLAINDTGNKTMVYVATDKNKNDILEYTEIDQNYEARGAVYNQVGECPKPGPGFCSSTNVLNS